MVAWGSMQPADDRPRRLRSLSSSLRELRQDPSLYVACGSYPTFAGSVQPGMRHEPSSTL